MGIFMIDVNVWMKSFLSLLEDTFGDRVWFVGLQGSYGRGEATETSDIDTVVILDELLPTDIQKYNLMLDELPHRELICGFISGKHELLNWEPSDLFQFYFDTIPIKGCLDDLKSLINDDSVKRAIRMGAGNIYHGCIHNMLYEKNEEILKGLYKSASFVIQAVCFRQTGKYISRQNELLDKVSSEHRTVSETFMKLKAGDKVDFDKMSEELFLWAKFLLENM